MLVRADLLHNATQYRGLKLVKVLSKLWVMQQKVFSPDFSFLFLHMHETQQSLTHTQRQTGGVTHPVHPGQRTRLVPVSVRAAPQRSSVPQRALLPQRVVVHHAVLPGETHGAGLHGGPVLREQHAAAAASVCACLCVCVSPTAVQPTGKMCQGGNPSHVTAAVDPLVSPPLHSLFLKKRQSCCFDKKEGHSHFFTPLQPPHLPSSSS